MIGLLQRVTRANVCVDGNCIGRINTGLLVLVGVEKHDNDTLAAQLAQKIATYRVFEDDAGKMNLSVSAIGGEVLLVPQFTLAADTGRGRRPSFASAAPPDLGRTCFEHCVNALRETGIAVETGEFGANMQVELVNNGPVTFWLQVGGAR
ncbi:MAG: D-aminoacyl-tRNA deacylase [Pseudomonadota bacterium]